LCRRLVFNCFFSHLLFEKGSVLPVFLLLFVSCCDMSWITFHLGGDEEKSMPTTQMLANARAVNRLRKIKDRVKAFSCPVCFESYLGVEARVGPCGHTLCVNCWKTLPRPLYCPFCRSPAPVRLPVPNFQLNELMSDLRSIFQERFTSEESQFRRAIRREEASMDQLAKRSKKAQWVVVKL